LLRIPIFANAHTADGTVKAADYGSMLTSIRSVLEVNPDVKIFAGIKLLGGDTFPAWIGSNEQGKIFKNVVQKPDPAKYAKLVADYLDWLRKENIAVDLLGIGNETTRALTADRYIATIHLLAKELETRKFEDRYKKFKLIGPDSFGVPTAIRFAKEIDKAGGRATVQIWGSHFYPDLPSGTIEDWAALVKGVRRDPVWHTELHVRSSEDAANIGKIRDGLAIVFATNIQGVSGYVWWARWESDKMVNLIRRHVTRSMVGGGCVRTSGRYKAKDNGPTAPVVQATRVGFTVYLWICNPGAAVESEAVRLSQAKASKITGLLWQGNNSVGPETQTELNFDVEPSESRFTLPTIPANSIALITIELERKSGVLK